jgi:hypothetical protein
MVRSNYYIVSYYLFYYLQVRLKLAFIHFLLAKVSIIL